MDRGDVARQPIRSDEPAEQEDQPAQSERGTAGIGEDQVQTVAVAVASTSIDMLSLVTTIRWASARKPR